MREKNIPTVYTIEHLKYIKHNNNILNVEEMIRPLKILNTK